MLTNISPPVATPNIILGALAVDDRGQVSFVNDFDPLVAGIRRTYLTQNHKVGQVRAWHGHKREAKFVTAVSGSALVCTIKVEDDWEQPFKPYHYTGDRFVLSANKPAVFAIPPGYANGWMSLTDDAKLMWFSTATMEESAADDYRWPARYWNPWNVKER